MKLTMYKNVSDRRVLTKQLTQIVVYDNVVLRNDSSIVNPQFDLIVEDAHIGQINYCYCDATKRYYYVDDIVASTGGRYILHCHVDVLMSYKDAILATPALIYTQTAHNNVLLPNSLMPSQDNEQIVNLRFSDSEFGVSGVSDNYVLTTYKGGINNAV